MYYYLCKRCGHITKQKIEMKRHLDKLKQCKIKEQNLEIINEINEKDLYELSLIKIDILNNKNSDEFENMNFCTKCKKNFYNKSNLNKHQKNVCFKDKEGMITVQNIIQQNNINNSKIINININNFIKGFDEEWDVSKIDTDKKGEILLSNSKFSKTLENILKNDVNQNVILHDNNTGIVYKNEKNKYEPMSNKEIIEKSMEKIYRHLKNFYNEIINNNINDLSEVSLNNELKELEKKYNRFFNLEEAKNIVRNSFTKIYNQNKDIAENIYFDLLENKDKAEKLYYDMLENKNEDY
jgi:hypothetical protein